MGLKKGVAAMIRSDPKKQGFAPAFPKKKPGKFG
jgi:hypothetical protein